MVEDLGQEGHWGSPIVSVINWVKGSRFARGDLWQEHHPLQDLTEYSVVGRGGKGRRGNALSLHNTVLNIPSFDGTQDRPFDQVQGE